MDARQRPHFHRDAVRTVRTVLWTAAMSLPLVMPAPLRAQAPTGLSDDQLISNANTCFSNGDYLQASILYFAYMERNPAAMDGPGGFRQDVIVAYWYSRGQVTDTISRVYQLQSQVAQLQARNKSGEASTTSGLGARKPKPPIPVPPPH